MDENPLDNLTDVIGATITDIFAVTVDGAWGDEPGIELILDNGTSLIFVLPTDD